MSSTESNIHESLARKLVEDGRFKKTSIAQAVWELVQSYIVGHTNPWVNITNALKDTKAKATEVVPPSASQPISSTTIVGTTPSAANDDNLSQKKTGTHG